MNTNEKARLDSTARLNLNFAEECVEAQDYNNAACAVGNYLGCIQRGAEAPKDAEARIAKVKRFLMW